MGVVYRAFDEKLERNLALKVLSPGTLNDEDARKRFRNEARILSRLNHPSIQTIHDFDTLNGFDCLISELVPGVSLDARLLSGALPEKGNRPRPATGARPVCRTCGRCSASRFKTGEPACHAGRSTKNTGFRRVATLSKEALLKMSVTQDSLMVGSKAAGTLPYVSRAVDRQRK